MYFLIYTSSAIRLMGDGDLMELLGAVDVHRIWMIVAAIEMKALKLWSVLHERIAIPLFSFNLPK